MGKIGSVDVKLRQSLYIKLFLDFTLSLHVIALVIMLGLFNALFTTRDLRIKIKYSDVH